MKNNFSIPCYNLNTFRLPKILLVEDNHTTQMIFQFQLSRLKTEVVTVDTGRSALQAIQEVSYDMMILDVGLPDITGDQVLSLIRAQEKIQKNTIYRLPIIIVTAHGNKQKLHCYIEAGANDALIKPIAFEQLNMLCQTFLVFPKKCE